MRRILLICAMVVSLMVMTAAPRRVRTTRGSRLKAEYAELPAARPDTVTADSLFARVELSGYDKPLRSRRESMFVTNRSERRLSGMELRIAYTDMAGRSLHSRSVSVALDLPPGETSRVEFPSWDTQQSFRYRGSSAGVRTQSTPYDIKCRILSLSSGDTIFVSSSADKSYEQEH